MAIVTGGIIDDCINVALLDRAFASDHGDADIWR